MFLNIKTEHSFNKSLCKVDELINFAKEKEIHELGIVDDIFFIDPFSFIKKCKENNIKPILGVTKEIINFYNIKDITIYPLNHNGIKKINELPKVITHIDQVSDKDLVILFDVLPIIKSVSAKEESGIFVKLSEILGENKLLNYNFSYNEQLLLRYNDEYLKDKMIFNEEIRFLKEEDIDYYLVLQSIHNKTTYLEEKKLKSSYTKYSLESQAKKLEHIDKDIIRNTQEFIYRINLEYIEYKYSEVLAFEKFDNINFRELLGIKLNNYLANNSQKNLDKEAYEVRLANELDVIIKMNFQNYFLIMQDIINYLKVENIKYGYGRGSAAGSLVSFLLNITKIDPLEYDLYFERFLNIKRSSLPDIDLDVSDVHRQQLINHFIEKYGSTKVAKIYTLNRYLVKSAFNEVAKSLSFDKNSIKKISSELSSYKSFEENIANNYKFFEKYENDIKFDFLRESINKIEGLAKNISIHAAGVVISNVELTNIGYIDDNVILSDAKILEQSGFIKFDLLALSTLSFISRMEDKILEVDKTYAFDDISLNYPPVYKALEEAKTLGVFQLESEGVRNVLRKYKPKSVLDIAIVIAMYRPGPMENIDTLIYNKEHQSQIKYIHKDLEPILKQTYNIMVFQEQIMEIVKIVADFSNEEADIFRVAISKKQLDKIEKYKKQFVENGLKKGYSQSTLDKLYHDILKFAGYGFNKAHAVSYARIIYQIMYIKTKYPTVFFNELFKTAIGSSGKEHFLMELESSSVKISPPNIFDLKLENTIKRGEIFIGLDNIKGLKKDNKAKILELISQKDKEQFKDLRYFLEEVILLVDLDDKEKLNLVGIGMFDIFNYNRKSIYSTLKKYTKLDLDILSLTNERIKIVEEEDFTFSENSEIENNSLGFNIKYSQEKYLYKKFKKKYPNKSIVNLTYGQKDLEINNNYFIIGSIISIREIKTKTNKNMAFLRFKMNLKEVDITVFPEEYEKYKDVFTKNNYLILNITRNRQEKIVLSGVLT